MCELKKRTLDNCANALDVDERQVAIDHVSVVFVPCLTRERSLECR